MRATTRKGLPLPDPTDVYSGTYPVGPPGRTFNITGIVRDTDNAQSNILDNMTEYSQNEQITGSWEFTNSILADKGLSAMMVNNTGAVRVSGDVVMIDPSVDTGFIVPNANGVDATKVLVVAESIPAAGTGRVMLMGAIRMRVSGGTVPRGLYLQTVSGQVYASGSANVTPGSFAYSLTNPDAGNFLLAMVHAGGAMPTSTVFHEEFVPANAATTVTLSQTPQTIASVFRDGVMQSAQDGHYTISGNVITFADAFDGLSRVIVNYLYGVVLGDANTVKGFNASSAASPQPGTLVATDPTSGLLPASILPAIARNNLLVNGGFEIWQRGNGPYTTDLGYTADRWFFTKNGGTSTFSISRDTTNMDAGSGACAAVAYTHGSAVSDLYQKLEDSPNLKNRTMTVSARVRSSVANAVRLCLQGAAQNFSGFHTGDGTYQTLTVTASMGTPGTFAVFFRFGASGTFYVDNAMLIVGPNPADYIPMHPADDLARCQRYYEQVGINGAVFHGGWAGVAGEAIGTDRRFRAYKAVNPTITLLTPWTVTNCAQPVVLASTSDGVSFYAAATAIGHVQFLTTTSAWIIAEANP